MKAKWWQIWQPEAESYNTIIAFILLIIFAHFMCEVTHTAITPIAISVIGSVWILKKIL